MRFMPVKLTPLGLAWSSSVASDNGDTDWRARDADRDGRDTHNSSPERTWRENSNGDAVGDEATYGTILRSLI